MMKKVCVILCYGFSSILILVLMFGMTACETASRNLGFYHITTNYSTNFQVETNINSKRTTNLIYQNISFDNLYPDLPEVQWEITSYEGQTIYKSGYPEDSIKLLRSEKSYSLSEVYDDIWVEVIHCYDTEKYYGNGLGDRVCFLVWTNANYIYEDVSSYTDVWYGIQYISYSSSDNYSGRAIEWNGIKYIYHFQTNNISIPEALIGQDVYLFFTLETDLTDNNHHGEILKNASIVGSKISHITNITSQTNVDEIIHTNKK